MMNSTYLNEDLGHAVMQADYIEVIQTDSMDIEGFRSAIAIYVMDAKSAASATLIIPSVAIAAMLADALSDAAKGMDEG